MTAAEPPKVTDWIQALVVLAVAVVGFVEFYVRTGISAREQARITIGFVQDGYSERVLTSASLLVARHNAPDVAATLSFADLLVELTPYHEYLLAFAICHDHKVCDQDIARSVLCGRIPPYEAIVEDLHTRFDRPLQANMRPLRSTDIWLDCTRPPEVAR